MGVIAQVAKPFTLLIFYSYMFYSAKEKLYHFRQLANPLAAEADLALLHEKNPQSTDFTRFDLAPQKNAEDILFALLDVVDHDEIVRNRREFVADAADEDNDNNTANNSSGEGNENQSAGKGDEDSSKKEKAKAPSKKKKKSTRK